MHDSKSVAVYKTTLEKKCREHIADLVARGISDGSIAIGTRYANDGEAIRKGQLVDGITVNGISGQLRAEIEVVLKTVD